jgi:regulator of replication initiation timing
MSSFFNPKRTPQEAALPLGNDYEMQNERAAKAARDLYSGSVAGDDLKSIYLNVLASADSSTPAAAATPTPAAPEATAAAAPVTQPVATATDPAIAQKQQEINARAKLLIDRAFQEFLKTYADDLAKLQQGPPPPVLPNGAVEDPESMKMRLENFELKRALAQRNAVDSETYSKDVKNDYEVYLPKLNKQLLEMGLDPEDHVKKMSEMFVEAARNPATNGSIALKQLIKATASATKDSEDKLSKTASENERLFAEQVALKAENERLRGLLASQTATKPAPVAQSTSTVPLTKTSPVVASAGDRNIYEQVPTEAWTFVDVRRASFPNKPLQENVRDGVKDYLETKHLRETYRFNPFTNRQEI